MNYGKRGISWIAIIFLLCVTGLLYVDQVSEYAFTTHMKSVVCVTNDGRSVRMQYRGQDYKGFDVWSDNASVIVPGGTIDGLNPQDIGVPNYVFSNHTRGFVLPLSQIFFGGNIAVRFIISQQSIDVSIECKVANSKLLNLGNEKEGAIYINPSAMKQLRQVVLGFDNSSGFQYALEIHQDK